MNQRLLLAFFAIYIARMIFDTVVHEYALGFYPILFFVLTIVAPLPISWYVSEYYSEEYSKLCFSLVGSIIGIILLIILSDNALDFNVHISDEYRISLRSLNPIAIANFSVSVIIALLLSFKSGAKLINSCLFILIALQMVIINLTGTRLALISLLAVLIFYFLLLKKYSILLLGIVIIPLIIHHFSMLKIVNRMVEYKTSDSVTERFAGFQQSIDLFLHSPLIGSSYLLDSHIIYPHNFFLETAMSLGIVGLVLLCVILYYAYLNSISLINRGGVFLPALLLQYFVVSQFSGSIWGSNVFWFLCAVMLATRMSTNELYRTQRAH